MLRNIKAIFFDLDNTLIDRDDAFQKMMQDLFAQKDLLSEMDIPLIMHKDNQGYTDRMTFSSWLAETYPNLKMDANQLFKFSINHIHQFVQPINNQFLLKIKALIPYFNIGIITNGSIQNQTNKYYQAGLSKVIDINKLYISQAYQFAKPNPELFQLVLDDFNLNAPQMLYIGDNPKADIWGANQLGIKTCWVSNKRTWQQSYTPTFQTPHVTIFIDKHLAHVV